jgi:hypothetical protein
LVKEKNLARAEEKLKELGCVVEEIFGLTPHPYYKPRK